MNRPLHLNRLVRAAAMCIVAGGIALANARLAAQVTNGRAGGSAPVTITRAIDSNNPPLSFRLMVNGDSTGFTRVDILRGNSLVQTIDEPEMKDVIAPGEIGDSEIIDQLVITNDLNFDGYNDLALINFRAPYEKAFTFWLYDPKSGRFKPETTMTGSCGEPVVHRQERTVSLYCGNGRPGFYYTERTFRPAGMKLVLIREEVQDEDPGSDSTVIHTTKVLRNGKLRVVKREMIRIEDLDSQ